MSERQITIRAPKHILVDWLEALRSGVYTQCDSFLAAPNGGAGHCCLGVLQHVVDGEVERDDDDTPLVLPTPKWLRANGVVFLDRDGRDFKSPFLPTLDEFAHDANDGGKTFEVIADAIEACAEAV